MIGPGRLTGLSNAIGVGGDTGTRLNALFTKGWALAYLKSLDPVALWVPGMQTDGFRVDGETTYLTRLTDLGAHGNHAPQVVSTAQAYLDGSDLVFDGMQWYDATGLTTGIAVTIALRGMLSGAPQGLFDCEFGRVYIGTGAIQPETNGYFDGIWHADEYSYTFNVPRNNIIIPTTTGMGGSMTIGSRFTTVEQFLIGSQSAIAIYDKILTIQEQSLVNQALTILGA